MDGIEWFATRFIDREELESRLIYSVHPLEDSRKYCGLRIKLITSNICMQRQNRIRIMQQTNQFGP